MAFFVDKCPECGDKVSKESDYCSSCGCPGAQKWSNCQDCGTAVGAESKFCWRCGGTLCLDQDRKFYGQRWNRSPIDFAIKVLLETPEKVLESGLLVENGTLAILFQNGAYAQTLVPGHYTSKQLYKDKETDIQKGQKIEAVLVDSMAAEVDFMLQDLSDAQDILVDMRMRLLFQISEPNRFIQNVLQGNQQFTTSDLSAQLQQIVQPVATQWVKQTEIKDVLVSWEQRELFEGSLKKELDQALDHLGLTLTGVRLAEFGGPVMESLKEKASEIARLNKELEINRRLADLSRQEKLDAFRDEEQLKDAYEQVSHEMGFKSADREEERRRFVQEADFEFQKEGQKFDYDLRKGEIVNRMDEQKLQHQSDLVDLDHDILKRQKTFEEDMRQMQHRSGQAMEQQKAQAVTDRAVAEQGIESLKQLKKAKLEVKTETLKVERDHEAARLDILSDASMQSLLATIDGEKADRLLKMAELEMRQGMTPEGAMSLIAEQSPEIAPAIAKLIQNRSNSDD